MESLIKCLTISFVIVVNIFASAQNCFADAQQFMLKKTELNLHDPNIHKGFPDALNYCGRKYIAYRSGRTHASDKGVVKIVGISGDEISEIFVIENNQYDVRNPYFFTDKNELYLYISLYDFTDSSGFYKSQIYALGKNCNLHSSPHLVEENDFSVVYAPISRNVGSFAKFVSGKGWCVTASRNKTCHQYFPDEEMALIETSDKEDAFGIMRNDGVSGLPLLYATYDFKKNLISTNDWCANLRNNTQLVSPKLYNINNKLLVMFAVRDYSITQRPKGSLNVMSFEGHDSFKNCNPALVYTTPSADSWDMGYPTAVDDSDGVLLFWYESQGESAKIYTSRIVN